MNNQHDPVSYKIGKILAYLIVGIAAAILMAGGLAILKLLIGFIL